MQATHRDWAGNAQGTVLQCPTHPNPAKHHYDRGQALQGQQVWKRPCQTTKGVRTALQSITHLVLFLQELQQRSFRNVVSPVAFSQQMANDPLLCRDKDGMSVRLSQ